MARKRFRSKIDTWLLVLLVAALAIVFVSFFGAVGDGLPPGILLVFFAVVMLVGGLIVSTLVATHYTIDGDTLIVVSGPMRWRIPIAEIQKVEATKQPWSSPALSLDRLRLHYGNGRRIMISPADKKGFLKAIGQTLWTESAARDRDPA